MTTKLWVAGALGLALCGMLVGPVAAKGKGTLYTCTFDTRGTLGWVAEQVIVLYKPDEGSIMVIDPIIQQFEGKPISASLTKETAARIGFNWYLNVTSAVGRSAKFQYRLTYYKDGRPAQISADPGGYDVTFSAKGSCKVGPG